MVEEARKWKSNVAQEAFVELCKVAGLERDRLMEDIRNGEHSEYERGLLRANVSQVYVSMIAGAYDAASAVEVKFLGLNATIAMHMSGQ